jgi:hypothetical protein
MTALVNQGTINTLRAIGNRGLVTDVKVCTRVQVDDPYGGDHHHHWPVSGTVVKGWLLMTNNPIIDSRNGVSTSVGVYRLNLPATVANIDVGDQVEIGGLRYTVNDVNSDDTYRMFTTCILRRLEDRSQLA